MSARTAMPAARPVRSQISRARVRIGGAFDSPRLPLAVIVASAPERRYPAPIAWILRAGSGLAEWSLAAAVSERPWAQVVAGLMAVEEAVQLVHHQGEEA